GFEIESSEVVGKPGSSHDQAHQKQGKQKDKADQQGKSDDKKSDDKKSDDKKSDDKKSDNKKSDDKKSDDQKSKDKKSDRDQAKSDDSKRDRSDGKGGQAGSRWTIERLMPGESRTIRVTAASDSEGAGNVCVAVESYKPAVCLATRFTKPELDIEKKAPETANICDEIQFQYLVKNTGTGNLQRFTVRDDLPDGLQTIDGAKKLEFTLDDGLKAGETRKFVARLRATDTGEFTSRAVVEGPGGVEARSNRAGTTVQKADLAIAIVGPQAQEVGGLANYTVRVTNRGDAPAPGAQLRVYFPRSADLVRAGQPQPSSRAVAPQTSSDSDSSHKDHASHDHGSQSAKDKDSDQDDDDGDDAKNKSGSSKSDDDDDDQNGKDDDDDQQQKSDDDDKDSPDDSDKPKAKGKDQKPEANDPIDKARRAQSRETQERRQMAQKFWKLGTLAPGQTVEVTYVLRLYEGGDLDQMAVAEYVCATAQDREMLRAEAKMATEVLRLPGLRLIVLDDHDPVAVGQNVTYTITVANQGNAAAKNIDVAAKLPKELEYVESRGKTSGKASGNEIDFQSVKTLDPGQKVSWEVVAKVKGGVGEKSQSSIDVELNSDDLQEKITSEEPTTFFEVEKRTAKSTDESEPAKK
ncbi:MAG: hypothetical protein ACTHK7_00525, partial [Aureliella sp.]